MDFIKTSSLRALIELTFQRNWNGLIWMSRKGVITKRVETVQTALSKNSAQPRSPAGRETMFRARPNHIRPSEVSAKVRNRPADHAITTRETLSRGRPSQAPRRTRTTMPREPGNKASRPRNPFRVPRPMHPSEPGKNVPRPAEKPSAKSHPPTTPADRESIRPRPFRLGHDPIVRPIVPHDRPNAAVDPKPFLKPNFIFSSPA
ncbi:unnamed protein product [Microthlaspi erraticum]|uniref:Uncharacterized protein n=1 Tax=Microthlaspi erraticum TaxID=1685480 RepID=A0A6D2HZI6_9BRAS|nr:unnamed protein product [Microthlaspi erraticum]